MKRHIKHNLKVAIPVLLIRAPTVLLLLLIMKIGEMAEKLYEKLDPVLPTFTERTYLEKMYGDNR